MSTVTAAEDVQGTTADRPRSTRPRWQVLGKRVFTLGIIGGAVWAGYDHRSEVSAAGSMLSHLQVGWLLLAIAFEIGSMIVFARMQRWLLRAGGVHVPLGTMVEIALAGNAMSTSLPGGPAWSATWAFGQLRRRGANRTLAGWVIVVAGALSSFAVFVIVAAGAFVAGNSGPFAHLRWLAGVLAAIPIVVAVGLEAARHSSRVDMSFAELWKAVSARLRPARAVGRLVARTSKNLGLVRPGLAGWAEAFGLALANWLYDAATLVACIEALGVRVPWHAILIIYGFTQISASLPITPGGLGVVEASMAALLVAYGTPSTTALAVVLLYRIVSFWGLVPIGWAVWFGLELANRGGVRHRSHPWATHDHGDQPSAPISPIGPERILRPKPCVGCPDADENSDSPSRSRRSKRLVA